MREEVIAAAAVTALWAGVALAGEPPGMQVHESDCSLDNVYVPQALMVFNPTAARSPSSTGRTPLERIRSRGRAR